MATALAALMSMPSVPLAPEPTPVQPMTRLAASLGPDCPKLFIKRDDLLSFGMGGNKVRKIQTVAAEAIAAGADTLITCGGVQSNHARVTAAAGAALGLKVILVLNSDRGQPPARVNGNALLDRVFHADVRYVASRDARTPRMDGIAAELRARDKRPFVIPLGASTATGALGFARGVAELATAGVKPTVIVHSSSSGGTQAGIIAGCALLGMRARVIGITPDDGVADTRQAVADLLPEMARRLGCTPASIGAETPIEVDGAYGGEGYGIPTVASTEALELVAQREGIVLDPVYTAKAMAGLIARIQSGEFSKNDTIVFWHTGGVPGLFA
jgi:L-cysteate sulfo-lyase